MRSSDLRQLKPFTRHVEAMWRAWAADFPCDCTLVDGRWTPGPRCSTLAGTDCRTATATATRVMIGSLGLPQDHLDDVELEAGVGALHEAVLLAPRITADEFQERVVEGLKVREAAEAAGWRDPAEAPTFPPLDDETEA